MNPTEKKEAYQTATKELKAVLEGETNQVLLMSTISSVLKHRLPHFYWVGFYCVENDRLIVGPYQGTLACLYIPFDKGVCGRAVRLREPQIVDDVDQDPQHIACDSRTNSEIVLPVWNSKDELIAVLDVDSLDKAAFDETDQHYLQEIINNHFK